jgi:hypothetical protein
MRGLAYSSSSEKPSTLSLMTVIGPEVWVMENGNNYLRQAMPSAFDAQGRCIVASPNRDTGTKNAVFFADLYRR